ncbi:MAG: radical SAM protein [bacterium]
MIVGVIQTRVGPNDRGFEDESMRLANGKPVLRHVVEALREARSIDKIVLAFPRGEANRPLIELARDWDVDYYVGEEDVLARVAGAAGCFGADNVVRVFGNRLGLSGDAIDRLVDRHLSDRNDYTGLSFPPITSPQIFPQVEVIRRGVLDEVNLKCPKSQRRAQVMAFEYARDGGGYRSDVVSFTDVFDLARFLNRIDYRGMPNNVVVEVTNRCNLRCEFCHRNKMIRPEGSMDFGLYKEIVDEISGYGDVALTPYFFGEPLVHGRIFDMIRYAVDSGIKNISISSNGVLLDEVRAKRLMDSGLNGISISVEGVDPETYRESMNYPDYERVVDNILNMVRLRDQSGSGMTIGVTFIKTERAADETEAFVEHWLNVVDYVLVRKELKERDGFQKIISGNEELNIPRIPCMVLWDHTIILWNGDVTLCCADYDGRMVIGNVRERPLREIWLGDGYQRIRQSHIEGDYGYAEGCAGCDQWQIYIPPRTVKRGRRICTESLYTEYYTRDGKDVGQG